MKTLFAAILLAAIPAVAANINDFGVVPSSGDTEGTPGSRINSARVAGSAVPEPASLALIGLPLLLLGVLGVLRGRRQPVASLIR